MDGGSSSHAEPVRPTNFVLCLFQMFSNSDEAVINKKLPKELLLR